MRYFAELAYQGASYVGWQAQPGQISVQGTIEHALSTILNAPIEIVGCGRTDAGVHAKQYFIHFDFPGAFPKGFDRRINKFLPPDIAIHRFIPVAPEAHARFDATHRAYEYHIDFRKNPFGKNIRYYFPFAAQLDTDLLQEAAQSLLQYQEFYPFCKSNTDVKTMRCDIRRSEWIIDKDNHRMVFHIAADRFLRGMVRLIVGMCLNVAQGKLPIESVHEALTNQTRLTKSLSAPPDGLYLTDIRYPFL